MLLKLLSLYLSMQNAWFVVFVMNMLLMLLTNVIIGGKCIL